MPGIFDRLGAFARSIIERAQSMGQGVQDVVGVLDRQGVDVDPVQAVQDWYAVQRDIAAESIFKDMAEWRQIPLDMHEESPIPWARPYAYKVRIYGVDAETGLYSHQDYDLPVSQQLSQAGAIQVAFERIFEGGYSPFSEFLDARVVTAYAREDVFM